ncbi:MAG: hypothetical protein HYV14_11620 [Elusimicrobia bacterium]|nr:hypothetical protein [Elusimicrobiota bacterium]
MKKLLGTTLALAMFIPAGANAELLKNFKVSGNLDIQTTSARNVVDFVTRPTGANSSPASANNNDRIGHATTRVIVKMDWDLLDDVHSRVTLVKGAQGTAASSAGRTYGSGAQDLNIIQSAIVVEEANVKIDKVFGLLDVTAGRQFYGEEGDLIVYYGPRDAYGLRVDAIDMFRADWNGEHMSVTGIAGKTADTAVTTVGSGNAATDLRGIVVSCKMHEMVKPSAYVYNRVTHGVAGIGQTLGSTGTSADGKNSNLWVAGVKAKVATGGFSGSLELAKNFGEDRATYATAAGGARAVNYKGYAVQLKAGYKLDLSDVGAVNPWGEYGMGTGDSNFDYAGNNTFQSINTDYRPGGIYGRFDTGAAIALAGNGVANGANTFASNGLSNRIIWGVGVKATPSALNKLTVGAAFYRYAFHRVAPFNAAGTKSSRNIGSEVDVTGEWKHSENVSLKATAGTFQPGAAVRDFRGANAATNPAVMLAGDVAIKF